MKHLLVALMVLAPAIARGQTPPAPAPLPSVTLPAELDRVLRDYERAWQGNDAGALAALFAEDGYVLSNGEPPVRGRAAIRVAYPGSSCSPCGAPPGGRGSSPPISITAIGAAKAIS